MRRWGGRGGEWVVVGWVAELGTGVNAGQGLGGVERVGVERRERWKQRIVTVGKLAVFICKLFY